VLDRRARRRSPAAVALGRRPGGRHPGRRRAEEQGRRGVTELLATLLKHDWRD
jgi:hypothetical protein